MGIPAIPNYLGEHIQDENQIPPGHRFGLYFPAWNSDWSLEKNKKKDALKKVMPVGKTAAELLGKIQERQKQASGLLGERIFRISVKSVSPFMTGVGMEHPVENGFAFLTPYGLPYLPGSSVKGVLRKAAEELALGIWGDQQGWDMVTLWQFFGFEASSAFLCAGGNYPEPLDKMAQDSKDAYLSIVQDISPEVAMEFLSKLLPEKDHKDFQQNPIDFFIKLAENKNLRKSVSLKGALSFWDVFPTSPDGKLGIDILNPHHSEYYQKGTPPANCELLKKLVFFLTVPPDSRFDFYVHCEMGRLQAPFRGRWKELLQSAFHHAFRWLGFGAKTSVGYGSLKALNGSHGGLVRKEPQKASKIVDAKEARKEAFERFCRSLPGIAGFPGKASEIKRQIEGIEDPELKKMCVGAAMDIAQRDPKKFKKARKAGKSWATAMANLSKAVGIEIQ